MSQLPEGRKPLSWDDLRPRYSTWESEAKEQRRDNERLQARVEELEAALRRLADAATPIFTQNGVTTFDAHPKAPALWDATAYARAVLKGGKP